MAVVTLKGHVSRALHFMEREDIYIAVGGKTEWENESKPPIPNILDEITDLIVMKKAETKILVTLDDENGSIQYMEHKYRPVAPENAYDEGARWVYCMSYLNYDEAPISVSYRTLALQTRVVRSPSVPEAQYILLPDQIVDMGISEIVDHIQPIYRRADKREKLAIIAEF